MGKSVCIIGGGISGLMAAYELSFDKSIKVTIIEKGKDLEERKCPLLSHAVDRCVKCEHCSIMEGVAGAGAFSDGKYNITTEFGGWLQDIRDPKEVLQYIEKADKILVDFGASTQRYMPSPELITLCLKHDLHMLQSRCKHLGTDANFETMVKLVKELKNRSNVEILTQTTAVDVYPGNDGYTVSFVSQTGNKGASFADSVIFAVGRAGSRFFSSWCQENHIPQLNNQVDIGVRVELPSQIWDEFEKKIYEPKIHYRTKTYGDITRMFCFNGRGEVVLENTDGVLTVNGHAYKAENKKTGNTNFALLSTNTFTEPFDKPIDYARHIAGLANMMSGGSVLVQRLGDLENGHRTDESRLRKSTVVPTLKSAVPGDLSLCLPKRQLDNIVETLHALNAIAPGTANHDTLLYGVECKYYSARPETTDRFELKKFPGIYTIGDGAGFTRSLAQAAAQGLMVAEEIKNGT